jgi:hypothetical protein
MNTFGGANFENGGAKHTLAPPNCVYEDLINENLNPTCMLHIVHCIELKRTQFTCTAGTGTVRLKRSRGEGRLAGGGNDRLE